MPTLKEILAERKRKATQSAPINEQATTDNQVAVAEIPDYAFAIPMTDFQALFEGCEDF